MGGIRGARWKIEAVLAALFIVAALATAIDPAWIEALGIDPDAGNGTLELAIVVGIGVAAFAVAALSLRHYAARPHRLAAGEEARS
jgi:hypothetical protein